MLKPEIIIIVKKGAVVEVGTIHESLSYRLIDFDCEEIDRSKDYEADATKINVEEYTKEVIESEK